jgi:EAL domain-containing protein (putative c-di-GMP-specific phosphodiesterase class I)
MISVPASLAVLPEALPVRATEGRPFFIRDIMTNSDDAGIVRAIIAMGNTLRLSVVAEGVEDSEQHAYLVRHGCSLFQGYLFGKPMSFEDFRQKLGVQRSR